MRAFQHFKAFPIFIAVHGSRYGAHYSWFLAWGNLEAVELGLREAMAKDHDRNTLKSKAFIYRPVNQAGQTELSAWLRNNPLEGG